MHAGDGVETGDHAVAAVLVLHHYGLGHLLAGGKSLDAGILGEHGRAADRMGEQQADALGEGLRA